MKDKHFLEKLSVIVDLIIANLNSDQIIKVLSEKLDLQGDGVIFRLPFNEDTAWGKELLFGKYGRFYSLAITHSEYFDKYPRELDYYVDYWFTERYLDNKFGKAGVVGESQSENHPRQNYCFWTIPAGKVGIQQSDREGTGTLLTEMIFIPAKRLDKLTIPVFLLP
jgi:hypothetical protein